MYFTVSCSACSLYEIQLLSMAATWQVPRILQLFLIRRIRFKNITGKAAMVTFTQLSCSTAKGLVLQQIIDSCETHLVSAIFSHYVDGLLSGRS